MSDEMLDAASGWWNTPLCYHENSGEKFGFSEKDSHNRYLRAAVQIPNVVIGPMPVETFLIEFFKMDTQNFTGMPPSQGAFGKIPENCHSETEIYLPLLGALNTVDRCPGFTFRDTSANPDDEHGPRSGLAPDVCCYSRRHAELPEVKIISSTWKSRTFMGYAAFFIEVKRAGLDPFSDPSPGEDRSKWRFVLNLRDVSDDTKKELRRALGQNATYATELFARQHRHCCFSVALAGSSVRLIRWDRAGAIVTERFDILTPSGALNLCRFLWCFSHVGDADRGYDLTVRSPTLIEREQFTRRIRWHAVSQMSSFEESENEAFAAHCADTTISVVEIPDSSNDPDAVTDGIRRIVISRPIVYPLFLTGRATRAYWGMESGTGKIVFLKDTWREDPSPCDRSEGDTISLLHRHRVVNVPPLVCHADLHMKDLVVTTLEDGEKRVMATNRDTYQTTQTQDFLGAPWVCGRESPACAAFRVLVKKRRHYRLVLGIAGRPLDSFNGSFELIKCTFDAFEAIQMATSRAGIGHRDITPDNIILYRKSGHHSGSQEPRQGYLIDWDIAWDSDKPLGQGGFPFSAAWQFVAWAYCLGGFPKMHLVQYDMESLLYVVLYCALLWLPHNRRDSLEPLLLNIFGVPSMNPIGEPNGSRKVAALRRHGELDRIRWDGSGVQSWVDTMRKSYAWGGVWEPAVVAKLWKEHLASGQLGRSDRLPDLPPLNGRERDGPRRYLGLAYVASSLPGKRPFDHDEPTLAENSTTVDRNVRRALEQTALDSAPKQNNTTSPATTSSSTVATASVPMASQSSRSPSRKHKHPTARSPVAGPSRARTPGVSATLLPSAGPSGARTPGPPTALPSAGPSHPSTHSTSRPGPSSDPRVVRNDQVAGATAEADSPEKTYRSPLSGLRFKKVKKDVQGGSG